MVLAQYRKDKLNARITNIGRAAGFIGIGSGISVH